MSKVLTLITVVALFCATTDVKAVGFEHSFSKTINAAINSNPRVRAAMLEVEKARLDVEVEQGGYLPSLNLSVGPENGLRDISYDIRLTQTLYDWGKVDSQVDISSSELRQKMFQLLQIKSEVALEIVESYLDIVSLKKKQQSLSIFKSRIDRIAALAEQRAIGNFSDQAELSRVMIAMNYAESQQSTINAELRVAEHQLYRLLQKKIQRLPNLPEIDSSFLNSLSMENLKKSIFKSPKYLEANEEINISLSMLSHSEATLKPDIVLNAQTSRRELSGELVTDSSVGVRFNMDISNGLSNFKKIDSNNVQVEASKWNLESTALNMEREIFFKKETFLSLHEQIKIIKKQISKSEMIITTYDVQFSAGIRTIEDLISVEREKYELDIELINKFMDLKRIPFNVAADLGLVTKFL